MHAVATPYRERSHFDGQDVLESGLAKPGAVDTGWLNRALACARAGRARRRERQAFAVGPMTPLVVRGPAPVLSWTPPRMPAGERRHHDAAARSLSATPIRRWRACWKSAVRSQRPSRSGERRHGDRPRAARRRHGDSRRRCAPIFAEAAGAAAKFMARADGPRIGALAFDGWDTHADEGAAHGRLSRAARRARWRASPRSRPAWATAWKRNRRRGRHRVRPHRAHQRHRGHRSRHRRRWRCSPAARSRAAASSPTGRAWSPRNCTRAATSSRPPICAPCSRACCAITCASTSARWRSPCFPDSAAVKPTGGLVASA